MKFLSFTIMLTLLTSCFGLFDKKRDTSKIQIDPSTYTDDDATDVADEAPVQANTGSGKSLSTNDISIITIDEKTIQSLGSEIVPRTEIARMINSLKDNYNASAVLLNLFIGAKRDAAGDKQLLDAIQRTGFVVNTGFGFDNATNMGDGVDQMAERYKLGDNTEGFVERSKIAVPLLEFAKAGLALGITDYSAIDGKNIDSAVLVSGFKGGLYTGTPLKLAEVFYDEEAQYYKGYVSIGGKSIKLNKEGGIEMDTQSPGTFTKYSFVDVLNGRVDADELSGDIIIFGGESMVKAANGQDYLSLEIIANTLYSIVNSN